MITMALLAGCGATVEPQRSEPVEDTALGDMVGTMDKARSVQDATLRHKDDLDRALQESEGADAY